MSSPHELSPIYSERTPIVWFAPADMKMFLRPSEEGLEEAWRRATTLLCYAVHILREACELTDFRQTSFGSTYMALLGCAQTMKITTPWTETNENQGVIMKKSREGLYTTEADYNFFLEQWETMRSRSEIIQGPEIIPTTCSNNKLLGLSTDCRSLTKATCGIAITGDQQSLIADLILDLGITKAPRIAGAVQRKQEHLNTWVDAYHLYQEKCNQVNNVKRTLRDRLVNAWASWPGKVWRMTTEGVQLVKEHVALSRVDRCTGNLKGFWNTFRRRTTESRVKQERHEEMDTVDNPTFFTGDLPPNSIVSLNCENRPDHMPFTRAILGSKDFHDDDQTVMPCKCPTAFEWKMNHGWDAEARLQQRIHIEECKDPILWEGPLAKRLEDLKAGLTNNWSTKNRATLVTE